MNLKQKIERSKSKERINFSAIGCTNDQDKIVKLENTDKLSIEPFWSIEGDFEGRMYAEYITEHPEYDSVYLRQKVADMLHQAADSLDSEFKLVIRAGHRPMEVQKRILHECMQDYMKENPEKTKDEALEHARTFVSDPEVSTPPHCCGAAVDVEIVDAETGKPLDYGSPINEDIDESFLHYQDISEEAKGNRRLLLETMLDVGFASMAFEWWHFSYGDKTWAWFYDVKDSFYDLAEMQI